MSHTSPRQLLDCCAQVEGLHILRA
jgi:hypothetical protein